MNIRLSKTTCGLRLEREDAVVALADGAWDSVFTDSDPIAFLAQCHERGTPTGQVEERSVLPPIGNQEVWGAGVTYYRSRDARMEESADAGGGDFYDRVYAAERPELFFKSSASRAVGHQQEIGLRPDSSWIVPEPELTVAVNSEGRIFGYTVGNDVSSRDIEGANPLYLGQAKVYRGSCALGPHIHATDEPLPKSTQIEMTIARGGKEIVSGATSLATMKRSVEELVHYLYRSNVFPYGSLLMTGTGIVPPNDFTLREGDVVSITIEAIGTLVNTAVVVD